MGDVQVAYTSFWKNHNLIKHLGYVQESLYSVNADSRYRLTHLQTFATRNQEKTGPRC